MCLTVAGQVLSIDEVRGTAIVATGGRRAAVSLAPIVLEGGRVVAGDWLLIHTGLAVVVLDEHEAREILEATAALAPPGGTGS
jgi:hydrogenase assembly chaperone HypC/HupF